MPGQGKYGTVYDQLPVKKPLLEKLFKSSPQFDGSLTFAKLIDTANAKLVPAVQQGDLTTVGTVNLDFSGAPKFSDVQVGGGGLPSTAWTPNPASPGEGNGADPTKQPDAGVTPDDLHGGGQRPFVQGEDGTTEPAGASTTIGNGTKLGKPLTLGSSPKP